MLAYFIHAQYCYEYLVNQIPMGLLLYSHLPTSLLALAFGTYVLFKARTLPAFLFFNVCLMFAIWAAFDLSAWFAFLGADNVMFTWSLLDFFAVLMFFFTYYFLYTFVTGKDLPLWQKLIGIAILLPTTVIAFMGVNIPTYDLNSCTALEDNAYTIYTYIAEGIYILVTIAFLTIEYLKKKERTQRRRTLLAGTGVLIFLGFFFSASFLVSLYASSDASSYVYNYLIYGLFGMPVFLIYLGYLIVRYHAFNLKTFGVQALVVALIAVLASEFAFVTTLTSRVLVAVTLILTGIIGTQLIRSVKREIEQREHIEKLAGDLEKANEQQIVLIHFITHQIKGFVTKSRNIFSMVLEGDFGSVPEQMKPMLEEGFSSDTKGMNTIQEILNAANIKSGKVTYAMAPFDMKLFIEEIAKELKPAADAKGLEFTLDLGMGTDVVTGDRGQLVNVFKNLIDNSIKYTQKGTVTVRLKKETGKVIFTIEDTGVGITPEDMKNLFTEGGHGKESTKVNVESTGFGLYIVKNIIDAHKGKVWAESEGAGKGSRFIVELPA
ncbi:MAG: hypothetical protein JWO84_464 [Parcubacteria group bacterium]|nr:hypothetical protein [Parcubacteria group bacterium]